jgi:hypothetical protein
MLDADLPDAIDPLLKVDDHSELFVSNNFENKHV